MSSSAFSRRRIAYKRIRAAHLEGGRFDKPQWVLLRPDIAVQEELELYGVMLQLRLRVGHEIHLKHKRRTYLRVPKLRPYELRANIMQAQASW